VRSFPKELLSGYRYLKIRSSHLSCRFSPQQVNDRPAGYIVLVLHGRTNCQQAQSDGIEPNSARQKGESKPLHDRRIGEQPLGGTRLHEDHDFYRVGLELKLQEASARRPTLEELMNEESDDKGLDRRR
jgi:hypothetical protein